MLMVTTIQADLIWESPIENLKQFSIKLKSISDTDVIILPEMFTTGFSMDSERLAEPMDGISIEWMTQKAKEFNALICGSLIISENGKYYNRFLAVHPSGKIDSYDKKHLFRLGGEGDSYEAGNEVVVFEYKGWKIKPMICYDVRFPVWARNVEDYDLLIYIASFPKIRRNAWSTLLRARSIENQVYTIGVNRVGIDGNGYEYSGDSVILDFNGDYIYEKSEIEDIFTTSLDLNAQQAYRLKFPFLSDRDSFNL